jgi:acyl-ACP thioesterase
MTAWPNWNDTVHIRTWLRPADTTPFVFRDYEIYVGEKKIGECTSSFTLIDNQTRKLARPDWSAFEKVWRRDLSLAHRPDKVFVPTPVTDLAEFEVRNSDLDLNDHVNNTKYAQWVLDSLPVETLKTAELYEYEINFLAETRKGDRITVQQAASPDGRNEFFQGLRKQDGKVVFTARLLVSH